VVQRTRQQFLARAGLALEEHGGIGRCHAFKLREHRRERRAVPEDPVEAVRGVPILATAVAAAVVCSVRWLCGRRVRACCHRAAAVQCLRDSGEQVLVMERFREEVDGPGFHGAHRHWDVAMTGEENNGRRHLALRQFLLQLQPAQTRELDIEHQTSGPVWGRTVAELLGRPKGLHGQPDGPEQAREGVPDGGIIIHHKHDGVCLTHPISSAPVGRVKRKVAP
jgi:hypothetical protein